jgi:hypothetical protein
MDIPEKFKNGDGTLNTDSLIKSYSELEKRMGTMISVPGKDADDATREKFNRALGVPADISEYPQHHLFDIDDALRGKFAAAGLNKSQVEKIYQMAEEYLSPAISEIFQSRYESESYAELEKFFGGSDKMMSTLSEIEKFGEKFLPADTYESLSSSPVGIKSIYNMMQTMEPSVATGSNNAETVTEQDLRAMMRDPKYWRDHEAEYVRKIESGFKKLYS